jgi:hypothetical protein
MAPAPLNDLAVEPHDGVGSGVPVQSAAPVTALPDRCPYDAPSRPPEATAGHRATSKSAATAGSGDRRHRAIRALGSCGATRPGSSPGVRMLLWDMVLRRPVGGNAGGPFGAVAPFVASSLGKALVSGVSGHEAGGGPAVISLGRLQRETNPSTWTYCEAPPAERSKPLHPGTFPARGATQAASSRSRLHWRPAV